MRFSIAISSLFRCIRINAFLSLYFLIGSSHCQAFFFLSLFSKDSEKRERENSKLDIYSRICYIKETEDGGESYQLMPCMFFPCSHQLPSSPLVRELSVPLKILLLLMFTLE